MAAAASRPPYHLSAGEMKKVAIAGILAMEPEVLVLDEPTTFLDPPGQRALAGLLHYLPKAKIPVTYDARAGGLLSKWNHYRPRARGRDCGPPWLGLRFGME